MSEGQLGDAEHALNDIDKGERLGLGKNVLFETAVRVEAALLLAKASLYDRAMAQLQPLGKMHVDNPAVSEVEGLCLFASGDVPETVSPQRRKAIDLAGQAMWDASTEHPEKAQHGFQQLMAAYSKEPGAHYAYGLYLMESDQTAALAEFQKEIAANPRHWPSLLIAAHMETAQGSPELALKSVEQAVKLAPPGYRWLCEAEIGRAILSTDQAAKAIPHFEESVKLEPTNAQTHFYLEQAYRRAGRKEDAQREKAEFVRIKGREDPLSLAPGH
jgi:tetratricopeptide (TPR) repeat protein